jgi:hypothetical protein
MPEEEVLKCFDDLLSYLVRRVVCERETRSYSGHFLSLIRDLRNLGEGSDVPSRPKLQRLLQESTSEATDWPTDVEFQQAWLTANAYNSVHAARVEKILRAVEEERRSKYNEAIAILSRLTIEHVMPTSWHAKWPMPDGRTAKSAMERFLANEQDEAAHERERLVNTFGNLTLLTQPLNSSVSNNPYADKQREIVKQSALLLNRYFADVANWDVEQIRERGKWLFESAQRLWPRPAAKDALKITGEDVTS